MRYRRVLFDLDGTLTDSGEGIMNSARYAFEQLGYAVPEAQALRTMVGPPLATGFGLLGISEDRTEEAIRLYRDMYLNHGGKYQNCVYPGIGELLSQLQSAECELYVATSKPEALAREILSGFALAQHFIYIAGATFDHTRESKEDVLEYLLEMTGRGGDTVMVGDTRFDVIGAHMKRIPCIGVIWGYGTEEDLRASGAEKIVASPAELLEYLLGQDE